MRKVLLACILALVAVPAAAAAKPDPGLLPPTAADAAAGAPGHALETVVHRISAQQALALATAPGATTTVAPGLSVAQAVGLAPTQQRRLARAATSVWCYSGSTGEQWGIWPYQLDVHDHTSWCAWYGGAITMRSTTVTTSTALCSQNGTYNYLNSGGAGSTFVAWRSGAYFSCPTTVPWITYHYNKWIDLEANDYGAYFVYGSA